jgi:predicted nucleic acid-binding protein
MVVCADTSFLFSLYANDRHSVKALSWVSSSKTCITLSEFSEYEFGNALRFAEFRKLLDSGQATAFGAQYEEDKSAGRIVVEKCNLADVLTRAKRLSSTHTISEGHRAFDILHIATALQVGAKQFLTFDSNQKTLARVEGLVVPL